MLRLMTFLGLLTIGSTVLASGNLEGRYLQESQLILGNITPAECAENLARWDDDLGCIANTTNTVDIGKKRRDGLLSVYIANMGVSGNFCEGELLMKRIGDTLVPAQKLETASKNYSLKIVVTKDALNVVENLDGELSSPGCGFRAFFSGNGNPFLKEKD